MKTIYCKYSIALIALAVGTGFSYTSFADVSDTDPQKPKLVLQITVDQLRGDLPTRYYDRLGEGGFRYLWESGIVYTDAHHAHANTETIVGHATLATGTYPSIHGMIGNIWFDRESGHMTYNIEDADYQLLTAGADVNQDAEIDPTQRAARSEGRSPSAMLVTTFADELRSGTGGEAKTFGVSVKDRGAVSMAGHSGKAFWFSKARGEFVTSNYYLDQYPDWVTNWNNKQSAQDYAGTSWSLMHEQKSYLFGDSDDRKWEADVGGFGRTFPHAYGDGSSPYFTTLLTISPAGDELTLDFAKTLLVEEELGSDADYQVLQTRSRGYAQVHEKVVLALRVDTEWSFGDTPFFALPAIRARGVPATRYQNEYSVSSEFQARWNVWKRWSLIGFAGLGWSGGDEHL